MTHPDQPSPLLDLLKQQLVDAQARDDALRTQNAAGTIIHIPETGKILSTAYEQLRNAAEYTEEHLLLQHAVKRFFKRNLFMSKPDIGHIGEELIVELMQAGYLHGGGFGSKAAANISQLAEGYLRTYGSLRQSHVSREDAIDWVLSILSVETESTLNPHNRLTAVARVAYQHYLELLPKKLLATNDQEIETYEISLYIAVHQALLKSDIAIIRHDLMRTYSQSQDIHAFIELNRKVSELYLSKFTNRLKRIVGKNAAALRILKSLSDDRSDLLELLDDRKKFLSAYNQQMNLEYSLVDQRVDKGIIKGIIFILITKALIGLGIEIPYDLATMGRIAAMPLIINLAIPPFYMASLKLGLNAPSPTNAQSLHNYIDTVLYTEDAPKLIIGDLHKTVSAATKWLYSVLFFVPFALILYILNLLSFSPLQMIIFFVFLSTASFLGFRMSSIIRELELGGQQSGFLPIIRDFFYLPFILFGQWLSGKYAKINAVGYFLDIMIELPLKTVLRLTRQWLRFLNEKHDEMY